MKIKNVNLEWYVLRWDFNENKVKEYNILKGMKEKIYKEIKSGGVHNKSILREFLKTEFMYHYWSKTEWEMGIAGLSECDWEHAEKIDVFRQIYMNLDRIVEYIMNEMKIEFERG